MMKRLLLSTLFLASFASTYAQDMTPPKQVTDLSWMVGTWTGTGKFAFGGQEVTVTTTMKITMDGQFLKAVSTTDEGGMKVGETMMLGWDPDKKEYASYTFAAYAPTPGIKHGTMDGAGLVMVSEPWKVMEMSIVSRVAYIKESDTKFRNTMEFKNKDKWDKAEDIEMTKQPDAAKSSQ